MPRTRDGGSTLSSAFSHPGVAPAAAPPPGERPPRPQRDPCAWRVLGGRGAAPRPPVLQRALSAPGPQTGLPSVQAPAESRGAPEPASQSHSARAWQAHRPPFPCGDAITEGCGGAGGRLRGAPPRKLRREARCGDGGGGGWTAGSVATWLGAADFAGVGGRGHEIGWVSLAVSAEEKGCGGGEVSVGRSFAPPRVHGGQSRGRC
jgi:hypothetical protein